MNHDLFLVPSPSGYPSHQYSSSQLSPTPSRRTTLPTTPTYDHAPLPPHPPAPPLLSGSTSYNPSFPVPAVPAVPMRHPSSNPSGHPPPAPPPILHRSATMPMPVNPNAASSVPYDMQAPNTMHSPSQPGVLGGPPPSQDWSYRASAAVVFSTINDFNKRLTVDVHERDHDSRDFRDDDLRRSRDSTRHEDEYMRDRAPPGRSSSGIRRERSELSRQEARF